MKRYALLTLALLAAAPAVVAQDKPIGWSRQTGPATHDLQLFHSTNALSLPTAETHQKGDFEFEISHRFIPPISEGYENLYGFDGPVNMRIALGYAVTNRIVLALARSNNDDNIDLWAKYRFWQFRNELLPTVIAVRAGMAWNPMRISRIDEEGNLRIRHRDHKRNFQYYGQVIINAMPHKKIGIGVVPSFLINRDIRLPDQKQSFVLGLNAQLYLIRHWSLLGEWAVTPTEKYDRHNPGAIGIELETGGHFFKVMVTNQALLNPSQYLAGADTPFGFETLRFGFLITRLL
jgi:hypothetical protein